MNYDVIEKIFTYLDWDDQLRSSHIIHKKPSQYTIAAKKLKAMNFDPCIQKSNLYKNAIKTGDPDLCTEALYNMYDEIGVFECHHRYPYQEQDRDVVKNSIFTEMQKQDKSSRIQRILKAFRCLETWDYSLH